VSLSRERKINLTKKKPTDWKISIIEGEVDRPWEVELSKKKKKNRFFFFFNKKNDSYIKIMDTCRFFFF
jgi:hypothetical protein